MRLLSYKGFDNANNIKQYKTKEFEHCFCQYLKNNIADIRLRLLIMSHYSYQAIREKNKILYDSHYCLLPSVKSSL